jgi:hypothetical protein
MNRIYVRSTHPGELDQNSSIFRILFDVGQWSTSKRTIMHQKKKSSLHFLSLWRRTASICFDRLPREKRVPSSADFSVLRRRLRRMENRKSSHRPAETTKRGFRRHSPTNPDSERRTAWSCQSHVHSSGSLPDFADLVTLKKTSKTY